MWAIYRQVMGTWQEDTAPLRFKRADAIGCSLFKVGQSRSGVATRVFVGVQTPALSKSRPTQFVQIRRVFFRSGGGGYPSSRSIRLVGSAAHNYRSTILETRWSNAFCVDNNKLKDGRTIDVSPCIVYNMTHVTPSIKLVPIMWGKLCVWKMSLDPSAAFSIHR